jgi:hypothetical protein
MRRAGAEPVPTARARADGRGRRRGRRGPRPVGAPVRAVPVPALTPTVGQRAQDRVVLAAGVVLGAVGFAAARVLVTGARTAVDTFRPARD